MILEEEFIFVAAITLENVWFCFRRISSDSWQEIKLTIVGDVVFGADNLTKHELLFLKTYIIRNADIYDG